MQKLNPGQSNLQHSVKTDRCTGSTVLSRPDPAATYMLEGTGCQRDVGKADATSPELKLQICDLDKDFNAQGEVGEGGDEVARMAIGLGHEAEAEGSADAVTPAAVQGFEQLSSLFAACGFRQLFPHVPHLQSSPKAFLAEMHACDWSCPEPSVHCAQQQENNTHICSCATCTEDCMVSMSLYFPSYLMPQPCIPACVLPGTGVTWPCYNAYGK